MECTNRRAYLNLPLWVPQPFQHGIVHEGKAAALGWGTCMKVSWRTLGTVLLEEEILDKAFSRAKKAADRVDDSDRVFRVRKQMTRICLLYTSDAADD